MLFLEVRELEGGASGFIGVTHNQTGLLDGASKVGILTEKTISRVDEVDIVSQCNLDDLVAGQICTNGSVLSPLSDDIGFVGLLPVHRQTVLITKHCHSLERELVGSTEDSNGDLSTVGDCERHQ